MGESDYKRGQKHGNESRFAEPVGFLDLLGGKDYVAGKQDSYDRRVAEAGGHFLGGSTERKDWNSNGTNSDSNTSTSNSESSYSSSSSGSAISGGYSESSSSTSSSGFGTFVFVAVSIAIVIGIISSFTNNSNNPNMQSQQIQTKSEQHVNHSNSKNQSNVPMSAETESIAIDYAGIADHLNSDGSPVGESTVFHGNGRYDRTSRDRVTYFAKYSGAIPNRTHLIAKIFYNGNSTAYTHHCDSMVADSENGTYSCIPGPYYLRSGHWEVRLFAGEQEINRTQFEIVSGY